MKSLMELSLKIVFQLSYCTLLRVLRMISCKLDYLRIKQLLINKLLDIGQITNEEIH